MKRSVCSKVCDYFRLRKSLRHLDSNSSLSFNDVHKIISTYREAAIEYAGICTYLINSMEFDEKAFLKQMTLHYLLERVTVSQFHVINLLERDPFYSHNDTAAINRGIFEAAVNFLYIVGDEDIERLGRFHIESVRHELNIQKSMNKWLDDEKGYISRGADRQVNIKNQTTEQLLEETKERYGFGGIKAPKYPSIRDRCIAINDNWAYFYDAKYRGLSAWQHGDISRIFVSSSFSQVMSSEKDRPLFESIGMASWSYDVLYRFSRDFADNLDRQDIVRHIDTFSQKTLQSVLPHIHNARCEFQENQSNQANSADAKNRAAD